MGLEKMIIGLTGNIACGKSTVADYFKEFGASVINADEITHRLYKKSFSLRYNVVKEFGLGVLNKSLSIDRKKLGMIVFNNPAKMEKLNSLVWPYVGKEIENLVKEQPKSVIIIEVPLLFEAGWEKKFDYVVLVSATRENQINRLIGRGLDKKEAEKRIDAQMPQVFKEKKADYIIKSNSGMDDLKTDVMKVYQDLKKRRPSHFSVDDVKNLK